MTCLRRIGQTVPDMPDTSMARRHRGSGGYLRSGLDAAGKRVASRFQMQMSSLRTAVSRVKMFE